MEDTFTSSSTASLEGQRAGALSLERKHDQKQERAAARAALADGRLGYRQAQAAGRIVRFAGAPSGAPLRGRWKGRTARWAAGGPSGGGGGSGAAAGGSGRYGQGRAGSQRPSS